MSSRRPLALAIVVALLALLLGACGDLGNGGDETSGEVTEPTTERGGEPKPDLPPLPAGQVQIEGQLAGSLTEQVTDDFRADATNSGLAIDVTPTATDEASAFASLCAGEIDFVDTSRRITDEESDCTDNGLEVVDFQDLLRRDRRRHPQRTRRRSRLRQLRPAGRCSAPAHR